MVAAAGVGVGACKATAVCGVAGAALELAGVGGAPPPPPAAGVGGAAMLTTEAGVAMVKAAAGGGVADAWVDDACEAAGAADGVDEPGGAGRGAGAAAAAVAAAAEAAAAGWGARAGHCASGCVRGRAASRRRR